MTDPQQLIEQDIRIVLGDLTLQLIIARANQRALQGEIERLQKEAEETKSQQPPINGKARHHAEEHRPQSG